MLRLFDLSISLIALLILVPVFIVLFLWIKLDSRGPAFFFQTRVGKGGNDFLLIKFRTMHIGAQANGLLTVGNQDPRVTRAGYYLRKYKLDELPQLINVLFGSMSIVGPRPEVRKYVNLYSPEQLKVISVKPGLTDYASIQYIDENEVLSRSKKPENTYIEQILPKKIELNMLYINNQNVWQYFKIILLTMKKIISRD